MLNPYDTAREFGHSYRRPGSSMSAITGDDFTMCDASHPNAGQDLRQAATEDADPAETAEWREALQALAQSAGPGRAGYVLENLLAHAASLGLRANGQTRSAYLNTIPADQEPPFPGNLAVEERIARINRWNALAMVVRANQAHGELGGHIASYASAADLFEVGFNHFSRAGSGRSRRPGLHAAALRAGRLCARLPGRLPERRGPGAFPPGDHGAGARPARPVVYPHPWLMPDFWQFPTGSMGIGPINAIYQARFMRYLEHRSLAPASERKVWGIFGDGEMDERIDRRADAGRARSSTTWCSWSTATCNGWTARCGNGRIIDELETLYAGAGWNVIKLVWGSDWDALLRRDATGARAPSPTRWTASSRPSPPMTAPSTARISSTRIPSWRRWWPTGPTTPSTAAPRRPRHGEDPRRLPSRGAPGASPPSSWRRPRRASAWARPARAR